MKYCKVPGCNNKHKGLGYCNKHYQQFKKHGRILERISSDKNEIIEYEDYAEIIIYNKQQKEIARALIDLEEVENIKNFRWHMDKNYLGIFNTAEEAYDAYKTAERELFKEFSYEYSKEISELNEIITEDEKE